ncbi:hypothetical protein GWI33_014835 [Rhynchophorus ferrugineus]|uniref:Uncharacterized protein n=1 Tax=Rhynchophorus ferrugineus TaxID=354439 RepID=A0A834I6K6_RHYFE|nr:hypothetical protein GWI33_014835 [Rhynchophorus ferrugineus]
MYPLPFRLPHDSDQEEEKSLDYNELKTTPVRNTQIGRSDSVRSILRTRSLRHIEEPVGSGHNTLQRQKTARKLSTTQCISSGRLVNINRMPDNKCDRFDLENDKGRSHALRPTEERKQPLESAKRRDRSCTFGPDYVRLTLAAAEWRPNTGRFQRQLVESVDGILSGHREAVRWARLRACLASRMADRGAYVKRQGHRQDR